MNDPAKRPVQSPLPIKFVGECPLCPDCGEAWCDECRMHYTDCWHPGPDSEPDDIPRIYTPPS